MSEDLLINIENGVIDFNQLLKRVKELEEMITKIKGVVETMDEEIAYLIKQDNKTGEVLLNHAEAVKALKEQINVCSNGDLNKKLRIVCKVEE